MDWMKNCDLLVSYIENHFSTPIIWLDEQGIIMDCNVALQEILGQREKLIGQNIKAFLVVDTLSQFTLPSTNESYSNTSWHFQTPKNVYSFDCHLLRKDKQIIVFTERALITGDAIIAQMSALNLDIANMTRERVALERANTRKKIVHMAFHDTLTGLPNRASLSLRLEKEMEKTRGGEAKGVIMFIDLDDLKSVNDNYGHSVGDSVIITAGKHIAGAVGEKTFVAHSGGGNFIIVLPGEYKQEEVARKAEAILDALCQDYEVSVEHIHMSASIGIAVYPDDSDNADDILKKADIAMSAAKRAGRNCWQFYEPIFLQEIYEKMTLTNGLRRALEQGELSLHYQPQVTVKGTVIGFEALLRWNSFEHGYVSPVRFIPLAEESGLILPIGQWVLQEACQFARRLADLGKGNIHVAVNISPRQLKTDDFVDIVHRSVAEAAIAPEQLEIEITESVLIESMEDSICKLGQLRDSGLKIALDDFGTGYSSLTYLRSLPVGVLKIDKSFIDKIISDKAHLHVVGSIIDLAHGLGLTIVAEGVETPDQLKLLTECSCDCIQGYIFSPPLPEEAAIKFLK